MPGARKSDRLPPVYSKHPPTTPIEPHEPLCRECSRRGTSSVTEAKSRMSFVVQRPGGRPVSLCYIKSIQRKDGILIHT